MPFSDLNFSDLLLFQEAEKPPLLKGLLGKGNNVSQVPYEYLAEVVELQRALREERERFPGVQGWRFRHKGRTYRATPYTDADNGEVIFLRLLPERAPVMAELGVQDFIMEWLLHPKNNTGLVLFCGAQSSGKTTLAASYIKERLSRFGGHAVTFENPIEVPLSGMHGENGVCFQSEICTDIELSKAVELSHRCGSPNIIFIGEIKGKHTAAEALRLSLGSQGQVIVSTLHGMDIPAALDRLSGWASEVDGDMALQNLSHGLLTIVQLELLDAETKKVLTAKNFLFCPFNERHKGIRGRIKRREFDALGNDITSQNNIVFASGSSGLKEFL